MLAAWHYHRLPREKSGSAEVATWTYVGISLQEEQEEAEENAELIRRRETAVQQ